MEIYKEASAILKTKCLQLWNHENCDNGIERNYAQTNFPIGLTYSIRVFDDAILFFENMKFRAYINDYEKALQHSNFTLNTQMADVVLKAMYEVSDFKECGMPFDLYIKSASTESCSYIMRKTPESYDDRILRLDLFRKIEDDNTFGGGLFHALKHFSLNEHNKGSKNYIYSIEKLKHNAFYAFFYGKCDATREDTQILTSSYDNYCIKFGFYTETETNIVFLKTAHIKPRK